MNGVHRCTPNGPAYMKGMLQSKNLDAFFAAAQLLNFGRGAEALCITPSALSQRIALLEEQLGSRLFDRGPTGPQLTEVGERLLRYCLITGSLQDELLNDLIGASGISGSLTVAGFSSAVRSVVMPSLRHIMLRNPNLRVHFIVADMGELRDKLLRGHADFIVTHLPVERHGYESIVIGEEINVLVESEKDEAITDIYLDHNQADDFSETFLHAINADIRVIKRGFCHDIYGILEGVAFGMGRGVVPIHLVEPGRGIRVVPDYPRALKTPVMLQYPTPDYITKAQRVVLESIKTHATRYFSANPAELQFEPPAT